MAATGFTLVQLYRSATPGSVPSAGNLAAGELAINTADEKLFFKNASGGVVEFSGGFSYTNVKTSNYAASAGEGVQTDTTGGSFTVTLPATPATGDQVIVTDAAESWAVNNLTVGRNGSLIEGIALDLICNISGVAITIIYTGTSWQVYAQAGGVSGTLDINSQTTGTLNVSRGGTGATTLTGVVKGNGTSTFTAGTVALNSEVSGTLPVGNGGTGATILTANNVLLGNGASAVQVVAPGTAGNLLTSNGATWASAAAPSSAVQYPQNSQSANYTLVLGDAGKQIFHPVSDANTRTFTIPANSSVPFAIGTVVLFTVENGGTFVNVDITSDTLVLGNGATGSNLVAANQTLMCIKVTSTKWMANYLYQNGTSSTQSLAVAHVNSPFITAYPWSGGGFGTKVANSDTLPTGAGASVAFNPAGTAIALAFEASPYINVYSWSGDNFNTKFANPVTLPTGVGGGVTFNPAGDTIAVAHNNTPFLSAYPWSGSGFGTKFADPVTLPTGFGRSVAFHPAGTAIAVANSTLAPRITAYPWSGSGFGTKFADPSTLPTGNGLGVAFNPAGTAIAVVHEVTPFITAYPWSGSGFGTKFTNPATLPTDTGQGVAFDPAGTAIAVAHVTSPFITAYPWSGSGFGTKFANPVTLPAQAGYSVAFSPAGNAIAVGHDTTPFVTAYPWSSSGFGTKFANPTTLPAGRGRGVAFTINP